MVSLDKRIVLFAALLLMIAAPAVLMVLPLPALGQGDDIHVLSQRVETNFPDNITFKITANSPDPIEEIRVFLKPVGSEQRTYGYMELEPGTQVSGEYVMPTGLGSTHKPPGTVVRYSFEIRDSAGRVLQTKDDEYLYLDSTLDWEEISDGILTVYYYGDFVEKRAKTVLETSQETMKNMGRVLGIRPEDPIKIVGYSNYRDMSRSLPFRSQAVREDLQTQGQAWASERVLVTLISGSTVMGIASHEFTHILVAEATGRGYTMVPAWLNEGLAEYGNVDPTDDYDTALAYAVFTRRLKPLWHLGSFAGTPDEIVMAYGQGKSVVQYLMGVYGEEKMAELMKAFRTSLSADQALEDVYGFDQYGLDSEWRQAIGLDPLPPPGELARQLTATPAPTPEAEQAGVTPVPTPRAELTPEPVDKAATEVPAASDQEKRTTRGCTSPSSSDANSSLDLALFALLGSPFFILPIRSRVRGKGSIARISLVRRIKRSLDRFNIGKGR